MTNDQSNSNDKNSNEKNFDTKYQILDTKYKVLDGNEEDQATKDELKKYLEKGWVTELGDGEEKTIEHKKWEDMKEKTDYFEKYSIDFISKNFQGTIQNDNLPQGKFWETWLAGSYKVESDKVIKKFGFNDRVVEMPEENHLMANGYANSWVIDADRVCAPTPPQSSPQAGEEAICIKNADGTWDFEMVVEFWPQRLFYIGLGISGTTLLCCLIYLAWDFQKRRSHLSVSSTRHLPSGRGEKSLYNLPINNNNSHKQVYPWEKTNSLTRKPVNEINNPRTPISRAYNLPKNYRTVGDGVGRNVPEER
jgi:hypothetical protein